jgi:predicted  nucleic acid-binding Zn-ribbon protein
MEVQQITDAVTTVDPWLKYLVAIFGTFLAASKGVSHLFRTRTKIVNENLETAGKHAQIDIIEQLQRRMTDLEREQHELRLELEAERDRRTEAEDMVDALTRRVASLEAQIRALGHEPVRAK